MPNRLPHALSWGRIAATSTSTIRASRSMGRRCGRRPGSLSLPIGIAHRQSTCVGEGRCRRRSGPLVQGSRRSTSPGPRFTSPDIVIIGNEIGRSTDVTGVEGGHPSTHCLLTNRWQRVRARPTCSPSSAPHPGRTVQARDHQMYGTLRRPRDLQRRRRPSSYGSTGSFWPLDNA